MRNTKIRFKYCTEENVDFIVKLPKEINMTDIIEVLGNDEATIENIEEGFVFDELYKARRTTSEIVYQIPLDKEVF